MTRGCQLSAERRATPILVEEPRWREGAPVLRLIRRAARLALAAPSRTPLTGEGQGDGLSLTILLTNDAKLRVLNASFRGLDKPTNVLSFPGSSADLSYLGDIAMAYGVVKREARVQGKDFAAHAAHLTIHGTLHLLGYDHQGASEARAMEALETALLARLGIADPYAVRRYMRRRKTA